MADNLLRAPRTGGYDDPPITGRTSAITPNAFQPDGSNLMRDFGSPTPFAQPPGAYRIGDVGLYPGAPAATTDATPAASTATPGSPLNTLYGVSNDSYLTDDQRKLSRMIQGKFDASLDQRNRELQRYGAPRLSSFAEDEALARAIAEAQGLNYRAPVDAFGNPTAAGRGATGGGGGGGNGALPRIPGVTTPRDPTAPRDPANPNNPAKWASILSGLSSLAPLLFGKDAYGNFLNKGALQWAKDKINEFFPGNGTNMTDAELERLLDSQGANGSWDVLPPSVDPTGFANGSWDVPGVEDIYGPGSGWGSDLLSNAPDYSGWFNTGGAGDWSNWWTPDSGGDILDYFGGV